MKEQNWMPLRHSLYRSSDRLNIATKTKELTEGKHRANLHDCGLGKGFLDITPKA